MTPEDIRALPGPELGARCARHVLGRAGPGPGAPFQPWEDMAAALLLVKRLAGVDFVLHRCAGGGGEPAFWMAWFGDCAGATAETAPLATCRAALLYALGKRRPGPADREGWVKPGAPRPPTPARRTAVPSFLPGGRPPPPSPRRDA